MNIYVGNLARTVTEDQLRTLFASKGQVTSVKIIIDRDTGQKRGFGFVDMPNLSEAQQAISELNDYQLDGQALKVNEARPAENRPRTGGGDRFGGDRGGYRGGNSWGSRPKKF